MTRKPRSYRIVEPDGTVHTMRALGASEPAASWPHAARIERMDVPQPALIDSDNDA
ncbi:hypothetical protein [Sandarakinorhabdus sp.]|uniref:hypothetical protein n=1 Tax=Sandarakinorhabdus sp. TaxID=1916663 RepID=UPI003568F749